MRQLAHAQRRFLPEQPPDVSLEVGYVKSWGVYQILENAVKHGGVSRKGILAATKRLGTLHLRGL